MCGTIKSCIGGCAKFILILINVLALVAAAAMIGVGSYVLVEGEEFLPDVGVDVATGAIALIVLGVLILMIGCFGCFGAFTGKDGLLNVYLIGVLVLIIIEIGFLIYGFVNQAEVEKTVTDSITIPFDNVNQATRITADTFFVDTIQEIVKCCGIEGPAFYTGSAWAQNKVPASCCADAEESLYKCPETDAYTDGCLKSSENMASDALMLVVYVLIAIIEFQIICMILAWCSKGEDTDSQMSAGCEGVSTNLALENFSAIAAIASDDDLRAIVKQCTNLLQQH